MATIRWTVVALVGALSTPGLALGQFVVPEPATISLIAESDRLEAGRTTWIGLLFDLDEGWHIYWINPGDAGDPPQVQWVLPSGFEVGDIRWPVPSRLGTGPLVDYGYEGQVLLAVPLNVPAAFQADTSVDIVADIDYVICREVCIPAKTRVTLNGEGETLDAAARRAVFLSARAQWPMSAPAEWALEATTDGTHVVLGVETGTRESTATFFPIEAYELDNAAPQVVTSTPDGLELTLQRYDPESPPRSVLEGVLVLGDDRAFEISVPVTSSR